MLELQELETRALSWPERAQGIAIRDQVSYQTAANLLLDIAALKKEIVSHHEPIKKAAFEAHRAAVAAEKRLLDPLQQAETILKRGIGAWEMEQERIRLEEQRRAEEETQRAEEQLRLEMAAQAEDEGAPPEVAEQILQTPLPIPKPVVAPTFNRVAGVSTRQNWRAEVTDIRALCKAVAEGRASVQFVQPNLPALNQVARAMKETFNIPGCRAVPDTTVAARTR